MRSCKSKRVLSQREDAQILRPLLPIPKTEECFDKLNMNVLFTEQFQL